MEWFELLKKLETPALIMAGVCIGILYRLLTTRDKSLDKLTDEVHELSKIVTGNSAIINLCCVHYRKEVG